MAPWGGEIQDERSAVQGNGVGVGARPVFKLKLKQYSSKQPVFKGEPGTWRKWSKIFLTHALSSGWREPLVTKEHLRVLSLDYSPTGVDPHLHLATTYAINGLQEATAGPALDIVLTYGSPSEAFAALVKNYAHSGQTERNLVKRILLEMVLEPGGDPADIINRQEALIMELKSLGGSVTEEDRVGWLQNSLGNEYVDILCQIDDDESPEARMKLEKLVLKKYRIRSIQNGTRSTGVRAGALVPGRQSRRTGGRQRACWECGGPHFRSKCPQLKKQKETEGGITCFVCGELGHQSFGCPQRKFGASRSLESPNILKLPGIDWHEKLVPTAQMSSLRMILALTARLGWDLNMADVVRAFTNANLEEDLYVEPSEGVVTEFNVAVGKLQKSLYGIDQASCNWNVLLVASFLELGLEQCEADLCLFRWVLDGELVLIMLIHVNDMLMASKGSKYAMDVVQGLNKKFPVKYLGEKGQFMGCRINRDCGHGTVSIDQQMYVESLAAKCGITSGCNLPAATTKEPVEEGPIGDGYRAMVGSLMWASIMTRPDVASAVRSLAMKCVNPTVTDWKGAERVIAYLLKTSRRGLTFGDFSFYGDAPRDQLIGYAKADYANCEISRFSVSGGVTQSIWEGGGGLHQGVHLDQNQEKC
ncbi:unnamed protein product, partial [Choristocarpus tenellus]